MLQRSMLVTGAVTLLLWGCAVQAENLAQPKVPAPGGTAQGSFSWAGARLIRADMDLQQKLGLADKEGLVITALEPASAAARAGLKVNDVVVRLNAKSVPSDLDGFSKVVKEQKLDEGADLVVIRDGKEETIKSAKLPTIVQFNAPPSKRGPGGFGGLRISSININGTKILRKQSGDQFSGEYAKGNLKITISGKLDDDKAAAISITQGAETTKYTSPKDVPAEYQRIIQQLMPAGR